MPWWDRPAVAMHDSICPRLRGRGSRHYGARNGGSKIESRAHFLAEGASKE